MFRAGCPPGLGVSRAGCLLGWVSPGLGVPLARCLSGLGVSRAGCPPGWVSPGLGVPRAGCLPGWVSPGLGVPRAGCPPGWVSPGLGVPRAGCLQGTSWFLGSLGYWMSSFSCSCLLALNLCPQFFTVFDLKQARLL